MVISTSLEILCLGNTFLLRRRMTGFSPTNLSWPWQHFSRVPITHYELRKKTNSRIRSSVIIGPGRQDGNYLSIYFWVGSQSRVAIVKGDYNKLLINGPDPSSSDITLQRVLCTTAKTHCLRSHILLRRIFPFSWRLILSKFLHIMGLRMQFLLVVIYMQARHIGAIRFRLLPLHPTVSCKQTNKQTNNQKQTKTKNLLVVIYMHHPVSTTLFPMPSGYSHCIRLSLVNKQTNKQTKEKRRHSNKFQFSLVNAWHSDSGRKKKGCNHGGCIASKGIF